MSEIVDVKKEESVYLNHVYNYMKRTIGVQIINSISELEKNWENSQFELSTQYQYEGINDHVWDYYLVFCCNFNEVDLDKRLRFNIESDRFCCRKLFLFEISNNTYSKQKLIDRLFPLVNSSNPIRIIQVDTIINNLDDNIKALVPTSFFTEELEESNIENFLEIMITKGGQ